MIPCIDYDKMLYDTVFWAYDRSAFYRWFYAKHNIDVRNFRGLDDYDSLPVLKKEDILAFIDKYGAKKILCTTNSSVFTPTTTGTLGKQLVVLFTQDDIRTFFTNVLLRLLRCWGYNEGPLNGVSPASSRDAASIVFDDVARVTGGKLFKYTNLLQDFDPKLVCVGETIAFMTMPLLLRLHSSPHFESRVKKLNLKYVLTFITPQELARGLHLEIKEKLKDFDLHIIPIYASVEMGLVGGALPDTFQETYCYIMQPGLFHVLDKNGSIRNSGKGELIYTSLRRQAFPFIKYYVGDIVTIKERHSEFSYLDKLIRFEERCNPLLLKIPDAAGYFIDVLTIERIVKNLVPSSQVICVHGQRPNGQSFLAIFIGVSQNLSLNIDDLKVTIMEQIVQSHVPSHKILEDGMSKLLHKFREWFPMYFIDTIDIPKESAASKPKILIDLLSNDHAFESRIYNNLLNKLRDYLQSY